MVKGNGLWAPSPKTESRHYINFVVTDNTMGCFNDSQRNQWRQC